jgi:hypothetical protein
MNKIPMIVDGFVHLPHNMGHKKKFSCKFCWAPRSIRRSVAKARVFSGSSDAKRRPADLYAPDASGCVTKSAGAAINSVAAALKERFAIEKLRKNNEKINSADSFSGLDRDRNGMPAVDDHKYQAGGYHADVNAGGDSLARCYIEPVGDGKSNSQSC